MTATFLVFLLCGQPSYILLDTPDGTSLYGVGEMAPEQRAEFLALMDAFVESGKAKRQDFKVESQTKAQVCGVST